MNDRLSQNGSTEFTGKGFVIKKRILSLALAGAMAPGLMPGSCVLAETAGIEKAGDDGNAPDYSREECWYKIPEIRKDVDTFFVYPTE